MAEHDDERRRAERHPVYMGAEIETESGRVRSALTEDASATGILLLTRAKVEPGQTVQLRGFLPGGGEEPRLASGRVVRRESLSLEESELWREKVAIELTEPMPDLAAKFEEIAARQAELYGRKR